MLEFLGGLIGAGTRLLGGMFSSNAQKDINAQNIAHQNLVNRNRIQWTVEDAKAAGINPLAALGNATQSYSNVVGSTALGDSMGDAGQQLGRAIAAASPAKDKEAQLNEELIRAKIDNVKADTTKMLADASSRAVVLGQPGTPPGVPLPRPAPWKVGRAPAYEEFYDRNGGVIVAPSREIASPLQTFGAVPVNAAMAVDLVGQNVGANISGRARQAATMPISEVYQRAKDFYFGGR